jgi:hypothetical protein
MPLALPKGAIPFEEEEYGHKECHPLSQECAIGNSLDTHMESVYEHYTGQDIEHILSYSHKHRDTRILHAYVPPIENEESQAGQCSPYADIKICASKGIYLCLGMDIPQGNISDQGRDQQ